MFALLFSLLDAPPPLNPVLAGYFCKVMCSVLGRRAIQALSLLQRRPRCLEALLRHVGSTSCAEVLLRLVGADDGPLAGHPDAQAWLLGSPLFASLLEALGPDGPPAAQANAAEVLAAVARTAPSDLALALAAPPMLGRLFSQGLLCGGSPTARGGKGLSHALDVAVALLDPRQPRQPGGAAASERREGAVEPSRMAGAALPHFASLLARLAPANRAAEASPKALQVSWGTLRPPLGFDRLKVLEFMTVMLRTGSPPVREAFIRLNVLSASLETLAAYPFHSLAHAAVEGQVAHVLSGEQPELLRHALASPAAGGADLLGRLAALHVTLPQTGPAWALPPRPAGAPAEAPGGAAGGSGGARPLRAGYMGFVTRLGNRLAELAASPGHAWLAEALAGDARWGGFAAGALRSANDAEAGGRWACGRPSRGSDDGDDGDDGEGLSVEAAAAKLKLSRDVYSRYDAYGDDDDEDDDEDDDDDVDAATAAAAAARARAAVGAAAGGAGSDEDEDDDAAFGGEDGRQVLGSWEMHADGSINLGSLRLGGEDSPPGGSPAGSPVRSPHAGVADDDEDAVPPTPDQEDDEEDDDDDDDVTIEEEAEEGPAPPAPGTPQQAPPYDPQAFWRHGYDAQLTADDV